MQVFPIKSHQEVYNQSDKVQLISSLYSHLGDILTAYVPVTDSTIQLRACHVGCYNHKSFFCFYGAFFSKLLQDQKLGYLQPLSAAYLFTNFCRPLDS